MVVGFTTTFIVWIVSSFSIMNTSRNRNDEGVKTTAMSDNQRPPKPLGNKGKNSMLFYGIVVNCATLRGKDHRCHILIM